jgi:two-component system, cell cycle response regulator
MHQNHLQPERNAPSDYRPLEVAVIGFAEADQENFGRFFEITRPDKPKYIKINQADKNNCDILMVNYDNLTAANEAEAILITHPKIKVVAVSRGPLENAPEHHIRGMLFAARVLTTLDKVTIELHSRSSPYDKPQAIATNPAPQTLLPNEADIANSQAHHKIIPDLSQPQLGAIAQQALAIELPGKPKETTLDDAKEAGVTSKITAQDQPQVEVDITGYRALVVDDSPAIQKSLEINLSTLPQIGKIDFAGTGEDALEKAASTQYDLIFLDVMMPGIDGYETCTRLRKNPEYKKTPIIMVSGKTSPLDEVKGVMAGCTTYLTKPVQAEAFQKLSVRVLAWLGKQPKK